MKSILIYVSLATLIVCYFVSKVCNFYMIRQMKKRKADNLLPDYEQVEALRLGLAEVFSSRTEGILLPPSEERVLPQEKMEELKQHIVGKNFDASWKIVDSMISDYEKRIFALIATVATISIIIIAFKLFS